MTTNKYVICLPIVRYNTIYQRTQHLMKILGRFATVLYLNPHSASNYVNTGETPDKNVFDVSVPYSPYSAVIQTTGKRVLTQQERMLKALGVKQHTSMNHIAASTTIADMASDGSEVLVLINAPYWQPIASKIKERLLKKGCQVSVVYDVLDNFVHFKDLSPYKDLLTRFHKKLTEEADLVTHTASHMLGTLVPLKSSLHLPNACDPDEWIVSKHCYSPQMGIVGYFGTMAHWFDTDVLKALVDRKAVKEIYLIGPVAEGIERKFPISEKIRVLGIQSHAAIARLTWNWSCGIIPFVQTPLTNYTDPVKLYEYMSIGMPIVANRLQELETISSSIDKWMQDNSTGGTSAEIYPDLKLIDQGSPEEFVNAVLQASNTNTPAKIATRRSWAASQTWESRVNKLMRTLQLEWDNE